MNSHQEHPPEASPIDRVEVSHDGSSAAFVVRPASPGNGDVCGIWLGRLATAPQRIDTEIPDTNVVFAPDDRWLAAGFQQDAGSRLRLIDLAAGGAASAAREFVIPGIVESLTWTGDRLLMLAADPGADTASLTSGRPLPKVEADPIVVSGDGGYRRIWALEVNGDGNPRQLGPLDVNIWQFAEIPGGDLVAICSDDASENGWYNPYLAVIGAEPAVTLRVLHRSDWQMAQPVVDPEGKRVAWIEGWASDRGLLAGEVRIMDLTDDRSRPSGVLIDLDVTSLRWDSRGRLWCAGWRDLGTGWGWIEGAADADHEPPTVPATLQYEAGACLNSAWHPDVVPCGESRALTVYSSFGSVPEVTVLERGREPRPWSGLNASVAGEKPYRLKELQWSVSDGTEIHGLLAIPNDVTGLPPLVVDIHGGPSIAWHYDWQLRWAEVLAERGIAVLMPNPRGSVGRGQPFGRANLGDPAGSEFEDILVGVQICDELGLIDRDFVGAIGSSYGGYLTAWAISCPAEFRCGVVIAGISDLLSCRGTANNAEFYDRLLAGPLDRTDLLSLDRSPVVKVTPESVPTLILHGEQDSCVPVSQAHELHRALRVAEVETELVIYPREGHQFVEPQHIADRDARVGDWFARHLAVA